MLRYIIVFFLIFSGFSLKSQMGEFGPMLGGAVYYGDLTPDRLTKNFELVRPSAGLYYQYHFNDYLSVRTNFVIIELEGHDRHSTSTFRNGRNLSFYNTLYEASITFEYNWFGANFESGKRFSPYMFGGLAIFKHNPRTYYQGQLYYLQPIGTEGQGLAGNEEPYSLIQLSIPVSGGLKFIINDKFNISIEFGGRLTFTDYIDDVGRNYPDLNVLQQERGPIAVALSYRTPEITGEGIPSRNPRIRGNAWNDYYYAGAIKLGINLSSLNQRRGTKCYPF